MAACPALWQPRLSLLPLAQVSESSPEVAVPIDVLGVHYLPSANPYATALPAAPPPSVAASKRRIGAAPALQSEATQLVSNDRAARVLSDGRHIGSGVVARVDHQRGVKVLSIQSTVSVANDSGVPLLVVFDVDAESAGLLAASAASRGGGAGGVSGGPARARVPHRSTSFVDTGTGVQYRRLLMPGDKLFAPLHAAAAGSMRVAPIIPGYTHPEASADALLLLRAGVVSDGAGADDHGSGGTERPRASFIPLEHLTPYALSAPIALPDLQVPMGGGGEMCCACCGQAGMYPALSLY